MKRLIEMSPLAAVISIGLPTAKQANGQAVWPAYFGQGSTVTPEAKSLPMKWSPATNIH
ncbi:hypothetical protein [Novipirellula maiorica]|nr:hypothetical protein [Rhodopirellula maiorica]